MPVWKYRSQNTHNQLSLHDCSCGSFKVTKDKIIMEMEWMEVLATHPDNPYSKAHQSAEGIIEFYDVSDVQIETGTFINKALEVLDIDSEKINTGFRIRINAISSREGDTEEDFFSISFKCRRASVVFNELKDESWFENLENIQ